MKIKVRAWDGEQFVSPDYLDRDGVAHWKANSIPTPSEIAHWKVKSIPTSSKIVELWTGLLDKNGEEIYEGDILKFPAIDIGLKGKWATAQVEHDGGCSYSLMGLTPIDFEGSEESLADIAVFSDFEVIGNIHENP